MATSKRVKKLIAERMQHTGENYTTARRHILEQAAAQRSTTPTRAVDVDEQVKDVLELMDAHGLGDQADDVQFATDTVDGATGDALRTIAADLRASDLGAEQIADAVELLAQLVDVGDADDAARAAQGIADLRAQLADDVDWTEDCVIDYGDPAQTLALLRDRDLVIRDERRALDAVAAFAADDPGPGRFHQLADVDEHGHGWDRSGGPWADRVEQHLIETGLLATDVDDSVEVEFISMSGGSTWTLTIHAPEGAEPASLYEDLRAAGWAQDERYRPLPPLDGRVERWLVAAPGSGLFGTWTDEEARQRVSAAVDVLARFRFVDVPFNEVEREL